MNGGNNASAGDIYREIEGRNPSKSTSGIERVEARKWKSDHVGKPIKQYKKKLFPLRKISWIRNYPLRFLSKVRKMNSNITISCR